MPSAVNAERSQTVRMASPCGWNTMEETITRLMRLKHNSYRTEKSYLSWIMRFKSFTGGKECAALREQDLKNFLSFLAVEKHVSAAT
jgi:hypothetical protein